MKKVVINASGGGSDIGVSANGLVEKNITLEMSNIIKNILESKGVEVLLLRDKDETISYDDRINKLKATYPNPYEVVLLSNTLNSGGGKGIEIIYPLSKDDTLPRAIGKNLEYFNDVEFYQYRWPSDTSKDYYYLTRNTPNYETIILRYGYADNKNDAAIINDNYEKIAESVANAVLDYIGIYSEDSYIVKSGDTLYGIAKKFNTTVDDIKKINNLSSNYLSVGQSLKLPTVKDNIEGDYYQVVAGDTLYGIAKKFNTTVDNIKVMNNLKSNTLSIGQLLKVGGNKSIKVVAGDTLYGLAKKYNTTVNKLIELNNLKSNTLSIGQTLYIP